MEITSKKQQPYASFGVAGVPLGSGSVLVQSELTGRKQLLPVAHAEILLSCAEFATLTEHAERLTRLPGRAYQPPPILALLEKARRRLLGSHPDDRNLQGHPGKSARIRELLNEFARNELLVSKERLREEFHSRCSSLIPSFQRTTTITTVGIPTRNRTPSLLRACTSYISNFVQHGRTPRFIVVDDSRDEELQSINRIELRRLFSHYSLETTYVSRQERVQLAQVLAEQTGVPSETVHFALVGEEKFDLTYGAARNTLLLLTAGELSIQVDDDTICQLASAPSAEKGVVLSSSLPQDFQYFESREELNLHLRPSEADFLEIHEQLLGKAPSSYLTAKDDLNLNDSDYASFRAACAPDAKVGVTSVGWYGDAASGGTSYRLLHQGKSFKWLTESEEAYRRGMTTRELLRVPSSLALTRGGTFMTTNIGLDGRCMLPPFMPVLRNEDAVFAQLLKVCFQNIFRGYLPYAVLHDPPEKRSPPQMGFPSCAGNSVVANIIASCCRLPPTDAAHALRTIGDCLLSISSASESDFTSYVRVVCRQELSFRIRQAERHLFEHPNAPDFWRADVKRYIAALQHRAKEDREVFGSKPGEVADNKVEQLKKLLARFGDLLIHWPEIYATALRLRAERFTVGERLDAAS